MTGPAPAPETDLEFLSRIAAIARNWRYSDDFIGLIVRARYPRDYDDVAAVPAPLTAGDQGSSDTQLSPGGDCRLASPAVSGDRNEDT